MQAVSIREVIESHVPSLAICRRQLGEMTAKAIVAMILTDTALMFNTGQNMNQDQIVNLTEIILEDYYYMKLDDLKLCFKNAMKGKYGQTYRMDASVILGWLEKYTEERLNEADNVSYENHTSTKGESKSETLTQMLDRMEGIRTQRKS